MSDSAETTFDNKCLILADLWISYRFEDEFKDFISYNDIGLPASFLVAENLATPNDKLRVLIGETFNLLLASLEIEDSGFEDLDELLVG